MASTLSNARKQLERSALALERVVNHLNLVAHYYQERFPEYSNEIGLAIGTARELQDFLDYLDNQLNDLGRDKDYGNPLDQNHIGGNIGDTEKHITADIQHEASNERSIEHS